MPVDPICGMQVKESTLWSLDHAGIKYFFCSEHCLKKFSREHSVKGPGTDLCCGPSTSAWYKNKTVLVCFGIICLISFSFVLPILIPFREVLISYFKKIWWAILLGLTLGGAMEYFIPRKYISHILAKKKKRTILYSVGLGFLASVCSHGVLAISMELYKKGASTSAVVAFLLASPWANLPLTLLLIGFFGIVQAFYIIIVAIVIAVVTGLVFQMLERQNWVERNTKSAETDENFSVVADIKIRLNNYRFTPDQLKEDAKGIYAGMLSLSDMVLWWILIGTVLASLSSAYIPEHIFHTYMGPTLGGLLITLAVATVLEVCSEGMSPLAFEIYNQTGALGNSFVFLMGGVVTDYTEIGLLWHNVGRKTALWLPLLTVPQVILFGLIGNAIF